MQSVVSAPSFRAQLYSSMDISPHLYKSIAPLIIPSRMQHDRLKRMPQLPTSTTSGS